jgi:hypothetical protein
LRGEESGEEVESVWEKGRERREHKSGRKVYDERVEGTRRRKGA